MMALADLAMGDLAVTEDDFWTGVPAQALPVEADLPTDLLLRQLPVPGPSLGGAGFVTYLTPLYAVFGQSPD
jgi:hypothetical protein